MAGESVPDCRPLMVKKSGCVAMGTQTRSGILGGHGHGYSIDFTPLSVRKIIIRPLSAFSVFTPLCLLNLDNEYLNTPLTALRQARGRNHVVIPPLARSCRQLAYKSGTTFTHPTRNFRTDALRNRGGKKCRCRCATLSPSSAFWTSSSRGGNGR
jgi:hypothetical protein